MTPFPRAIFRRKGENITLERAQPQTFDLGKVVIAPPVKVCVRAHVQPLSARALEALKRGDRMSEGLAVFVRGGLVDDPATLPTEKDTFTRRGKRYEVQKVDEFPGHVEAAALRVDV